jgi:NADH-quinone oxidoreductase subunit J
MSTIFILLAGLTIGSAAAAMLLRNLVHCALSLAVTFVGLAALYLHLNAQFVGFAQILVYVGAVAILIMFAILLTRGSEPTGQRIFSGSWMVGVGSSALVLGLIGWAVLKTNALPDAGSVPAAAPVRTIGRELMSTYVLPMQVVGLLLTAALIGAVILAMQEKKEDHE